MEVLVAQALNCCIQSVYSRLADPFDLQFFIAVLHS